MEIKRDYYLQQLVLRKDNGMIKVITGIRRCGKSYLLFNIFKKYLLENGVDIYTIKDLMGHTNVRTTQIYTHIVNEQKEKAANTLHIDNLNL